MRRNKKNPLIGVIIAAVIFIVPWIFNENADIINNEPPLENVLLTAHFIDVGQGDCTLIELPENKVMLIDAGENGKEGIVTRYIDSLDIKKIDYLVATHPHSDHIGGMEEVIEKYDIGAMYMPDVETVSATFENMLNAAEDKNLILDTAEAGKNIFEYSVVKADIISPAAGKNYDNLNNSSAVVRIMCGEKSFLFMGDAEKQAELDILESGYEVYCDVLKVAHHGSYTSSEMSFLEKARPEYAVISCGAGNEYGHPHKTTLNSFKKIEAKVLRTDELGTIKIKTDGKKLAVER